MDASAMVRLYTHFRLPVWLAAGLMAFPLSGIPAAASQQVRVVNLVSGQMLRLRTEGNSNSTVIAYIPFDSREVTLAGECGDEWCNISFRGLTGWAYKKYLEVGPQQQEEAAAQAPAPAAAGPAKEAEKAEKPENADNAEKAQKEKTVQTAALPAGAATGQDAVPPGPLKHYTVEGILNDQPLTIRSTADNNADVLGVIPAGAKDIEGLKRCITKWCMVRYNSVTGWTLRRHLADMELKQPKRYKVTGMEITGRLFVKDYPSDEADDVGAIPAFASGLVQIGDCKDWCHIRFLGTVGWVNSQFITPENKN
jgi:SH3-like domain-containing protein